MHVNPTGRFVTGGPMGDAGLTGRKIIVDTYGGMARHGGGAFSGKDPTKVDRSAAYAARWVAKNVVAAGLADRFEVEVAYGIGIARPISFSVESFGTGRIPDADIQRLIEQHFDLRPAAIISALDLRRPIYRQTAAYGHFGRTDLDLPWERTDKAAMLADAAGLGRSGRGVSHRLTRSRQRDPVPAGREGCLPRAGSPVAEECAGVRLEDGDLVVVERRAPRADRSRVGPPERGQESPGAMRDRRCARKSSSRVPSAAGIGHQCLVAHLEIAVSDPGPDRRRGRPRVYRRQAMLMRSTSGPGPRTRTGRRAPPTRAPTGRTGSRPARACRSAPESARSHGSLDVARRHVAAVADDVDELGVRERRGQGRAAGRRSWASSRRTGDPRPAGTAAASA